MMKHKSFEMKYFVSCVALNLLFLASFVSSNKILQDTTKYDEHGIESQHIQFFEVRATLQLACNGTESKGDVIWKRDDHTLKSKEHTIFRKERDNNHRLIIEKAAAEEAGNYSCIYVVDGVEEDRIDFTVSSKPAVKVQANINVVEGEKLHIACTVLGKPIPIVTWQVGNETYESTSDRIKLITDPDSGVPNAILVIENVELSDRKKYTCMATSPINENIMRDATSQVRVKDKLAALWPFLGICAEVLVLCAVILVYEKKRNKTELEESDTDQSPDQKNTPDHGKDSDVRHRK